MWAIKLLLSVSKSIFSSFSIFSRGLNSRPPHSNTTSPPQLHFLQSPHTPCSYLDNFHPAFPPSSPNSWVSWYPHFFFSFSDRLVTGYEPANHPLTLWGAKQTAKMKSKRKIIKRWWREQRGKKKKHERQWDDHHTAREEERACDVVQTRLRSGRVFREKKEMLPAIKRNNYNSEPRGSSGFTGRQRTHVYKCLLLSAPDWGRLQSSGDTCCPLAFIVSNRSRLCWFIFLLVKNGSSHVFNLLSRELHNEIRRAVNQQRSLLGWGLGGKEMGGGGGIRGE